MERWLPRTALATTVPAIIRRLWRTVLLPVTQSPTACSVSDRTIQTVALISAMTVADTPVPEIKSAKGHRNGQASSGRRRSRPSWVLQTFPKLSSGGCFCRRGIGVKSGSSPKSKRYTIFGFSDSAAVDPVQIMSHFAIHNVVSAKPPEPPGLQAAEPGHKWSTLF